MFVFPCDPDVDHNEYSIQNSKALRPPPSKYIKRANVVLCIAESSTEKECFLQNANLQYVKHYNLKRWNEELKWTEPRATWSDFKAGPALRSSLDKKTFKGPFQHNFSMIPWFYELHIYILVCRNVLH